MTKAVIKIISTKSYSALFSFNCHSSPSKCRTASIVGFGKFVTGMFNASDIITKDRFAAHKALLSVTSKTARVAGFISLANILLLL